MMNRASGRRRAPWSNQRGAVLLFVAMSMVAMLGMTGLAIDAGRAYILRARMARAVDAGALAAARSLRLGQDVARQQALAVAAANGISAEAGIGVDVVFGTNSHGEQTIRVSAAQAMPTLFMRVLGRDAVDVGAAAVAAVPPVDLILVIDQSGSLQTVGAWEDLQIAAKEFVRNFDDGMDQLGLVSFQLRATHRTTLDHYFSVPTQAAIDAMNSAGDTNAGEGLRLALEQLQGPRVRERSAKVVVFFTDGRPTAFRGLVAGEDRMLAVYNRPEYHVRGYFDDPDQLPTDALADPDGCGGAAVCHGWNQAAIRDRARQDGLDVSALIRAEGAYVYTIGLGDPTADHPFLTPDLDYLKLLANEGGIANPNEPRGHTYFAPSAAELREVFQAVTRDLLFRLAS